MTSHRKQILKNPLKALTPLLGGVAAPPSNCLFPPFPQSSRGAASPFKVLWPRLSQLHRDTNKSLSSERSDLQDRDGSPAKMGSTGVQTCPWSFKPPRKNVNSWLWSCPSLFCGLPSYPAEQEWIVSAPVHFKGFVFLEFLKFLSLAPTST